MYTTPYYNLDREYENNINRYRIQWGFTNKVLAKKIGISEGYLWHIEQGLTGPYKYGRPGEMKEWAKNLCIVLMRSGEDIWPREVCPLQKPVKVFTEIEADMMVSGFSLRMAGKDKNKCSRERLRYILTKAMDRLPEREINTLVYRYLDGHTLTGVSNIVGVTRERVRQIEQRALRRLRHPSRARIIKEEL